MLFLLRRVGAEDTATIWIYRRCWESAKNARTSPQLSNSLSRVQFEMRDSLYFEQPVAYVEQPKHAKPFEGPIAVCKETMAALFLLVL